MSKILSKKINLPLGRFLPVGLEIQQARLAPLSPATLFTQDGRSGVGTCLRCPTPPCLTYGVEELIVPALPRFPADLDNRVCATAAIQREETSGQIAVDDRACIGCGLCVARCPAGALFLDATLRARVNDSPSDLLVEATTPHTEESFAQVYGTLRKARRSVAMTNESDRVIGRLLNQIERATQQQSTQFPNHLSRNLMLAVGARTAMRRRGDVNVRMDLVFSGPDASAGTAEVEFGGQALLDSPRNVLDNVAVLASRYGMNVASISTLIVSTALPNVRAEYWRVIKDVRAVLGLRIESVTVPALFLMVWNGASWPKSGTFYADEGSPTIRDALSQAIIRDVRLSDGAGAALEAAK